KPLQDAEADYEKAHAAVVARAAADAKAANDAIIARRSGGARQQAACISKNPIIVHADAVVDGEVVSHSISRYQGLQAELADIGMTTYITPVPVPAGAQ